MSWSFVYFQKLHFNSDHQHSDQIIRTVPTKAWYKLWESMVTVLLATGGGVGGGGLEVAVDGGGGARAVVAMTR